MTASYGTPTAPRAPAGTPAAIRDALPPSEGATFVREYREVMAEAAEDLDLTPVTDCLERWRRTAVFMADPVAHARAMETAARLSRGEPVETVDAHEVLARYGLAK
jgi:hypothetical protein